MQSDPKPDEITRLLHAWKSGSSDAQDQLWHLLYGELKGLARGVLRRQGRDARHQATSLVHKAYLRLLGSEVDWSDRRHFFAVAARVIEDTCLQRAAAREIGGVCAGLRVLRVGARLSVERLLLAVTARRRSNIAASACLRSCSRRLASRAFLISGVGFNAKTSTRSSAIPSAASRLSSPISS